jgi:hypothetical protein
MSMTIEEARRTAIDDWRRNYRKTVVSKVVWRVSLIILICGSLFAVAYGFHV